jgi:hypothetical protein
MNDYGASVRELPDGGFIIAGRSEQTTQIYDSYLLRTDSFGTLLWQRFYDLGDDERAHAVCMTPDGGFLLAGQAWIFHGPFGDYDVWLIKTNANGIVEWERTYAADTWGADVALSVEPTLDGGFIIGGFTHSTAWASYVFRIDAAGNPVWEKTYLTEDQNECYSVQPLADGNFVMSGELTSNMGDSNVLIAKLAANGDMMWHRSFGGAEEESGECVRQMPAGGFVIGGMTSSYGSGQWDVYVLRTDSEGNLEWSETFGGNGDDRAHCVHPTADGHVLVGGWAWSFGQGLGDVYLLKITDGVSTAATLGTGTAPESLLHLNAWPNPSRGAMTIGLELGRSSSAQIVIVEASGRLVREISNGPLSAGHHTLSWNGRDERGLPVASGVYFVRFRDQARESTHRLTVLR